jgi:predicted nucleic-acid-binding Zn-ribbon protein
MSFSTIDLLKSSPKKDFGCGFYTTTDKYQAEKFACLKAKRINTNKGYVEVFNLKNHEGLNIKQFDSSNEEWFDFVLFNRGYGELTQKTTSTGSNNIFDIVIGPVANDAVGLVLNQFVTGVFGDPVSAEAKATAMRLLLSQKLHNQVFFGTEKAVSRLSFSEVYDVCVN